MTMNEVWQLGPRTVLRPGDLFRPVAGSGPTYRKQPVGVRGVFQLRRVVRRRSRVYLEADQIRGSGSGVHLVYVSGPTYGLPGMPAWRMRPYKIRRAKA
jgi:hypothetical protein